jgi:hypothetical protein
MAMVNYDDLIRGQSRTFTTQSQQATIASDNHNTYAESQWGYVNPPTGNVVAGKSNISGDYGTDPRSIAYMAWNYSMYPTYFHDYIYRWQFSNSTQPAFFTQAEQATTVVGHGLEYWHEPFSVTINSGEHSVLVTGIYSYTDPASNYPADIDSVVYHDPQNGNRYQATFYQWGRDGIYESGGGTYSLWSQFYGATGPSQRDDPDSSIGAYKVTPSAPQHWYGGFTWIQRDSHYSGVTWSPDWSYTSTNVLMQTP